MDKKETNAAPKDGAQDEPGNSIAIRGPREWRVLRRLMIGPASREELDITAGASNSPDLVFRLRSRGLNIDCELATHVDRDGQNCRHGVYSLESKSREVVRDLLAQRAARGRQP